MIDNKVKGKSFSGCVKYVINQEDAELIDTNLSGRNPREMIAEFQLGRHLNTNVKNIVFHASLSASPGEELSNETWKAIARDYLLGMGFDDNQYIVGVNIGFVSPGAAISYTPCPVYFLAIESFCH